VARDPEKSDFGVSAFGVSGFSTTTKTCIVDSRSTKSRSDVASGTRFLVEYRWKHIGIWGIEVPIEGRGGGVESTRAIAYRHIGVRGSGIPSVSESLFHIGRFPDKESPNGTEC
jgi:hypothetical protein